MRHLRLFVSLSVIALFAGLIINFLLLPLSSNDLTLEEAWAQVPPVSAEMEALFRQVESVPASVVTWYGPPMRKAVPFLDYYLVVSEEWPAAWTESERRDLMELAEQVDNVWEQVGQHAEVGVLYQRLHSRHHFTKAVFAAASALESSEDFRGSGWKLLALASGLVVHRNGIPRAASREPGVHAASLLFRGLPYHVSEPPPGRSIVTAPPEVVTLARERSERRLRVSWLIHLDRLKYVPRRWSTVWWLRDRLHAEGVSTGRIDLGSMARLMKLRGESDELQILQEIAMRLRRDYEWLRAEPPARP